MGKVADYREDILNIFHFDLPWEKLSGCNILITGATGLIGGCLVDTLMMNPNRDYDVYASGRDEVRAKSRFKVFAEKESFHFVKYDVMRSLESNVRFDYIIHAASNGSPNFFAKKPVEVMKSNIYGVTNLMDYGLTHGMKRMLFVSSGEVYGEGDSHEFSEEDSGYVNCLIPRSCYPSSKRAAETLCACYAAEYGADVVIARPCHTYGPYFTDQDNRVYAQFLRNVLRGEDIIMKSSGSQYRSWCYVVDCVSAILFIMLKGKSGEAYNIADPTSNITIRELAEMIADIGGRKVVISAPSEEEKKGFNPVSKSLYNIDKIKKLGWYIDSTMEDKIRATLNQIGTLYTL